jgi:hypothetical protein
MENGYDWRELDALPTLTVGQADDLKIDNGDGLRVWLARTTRADGEHCDHHVSVERFIDGQWLTMPTTNTVWACCNSTIGPLCGHMRVDDSI